ncbi:hypothetical protein VP141O351_P0013 [Vibrio phage 141O35-1]|nr:hypothetical protein VP141O351_P0013 [Vibrio phage 141O35-1]CAH9015020.1 hypothetical protein VP141E351_P0012 [Vibrio phage 141E35-1]
MGCSVVVRPNSHSDTENLLCGVFSSHGSYHYYSI